MIILLLLFLSGLHSQTQLIIKDFDWRIYKTKHFDIYYYPGAEGWLNFVSQLLEESYNKGKSEYNPKIDKRIPFFFFITSDDFQQNSISQTGEGTGGFTEPYKDRFLVYSDGSKRWLRYVIFHEFGHEMQFSILVDGWWESPRIVKTIFYPLWMLEGMSENMTEEWDIATEDMYVRDYFVDGKLPHLEKLFGFAHLKPHQITLAYKTSAKAIRFLREEYGYDKPSMLLYHFRNLYDVNTVLKKTIGLDIYEFNDKFNEYLAYYFSKQISENKLVEASNYADRITSDVDDIPVFNTSPVIVGEDKIAYISTLKMYPSVVIEDRKTKTKKILDKAYTGLDYIPYSKFTFPIRTLSSLNNYILFIGKKSHKSYFCIYDTLNDRFKKVIVKDVDELGRASFSPDGKKIVFSAMKNGFYDIYEIDFDVILKNRELKYSDFKRITSDSDYDDLPQYLLDGRVIFMCEKGEIYDVRNNICVYDRGEKKIVFDKIDVLDYYYDKKTNTIYFVSSLNGIYNLYSYNLSNGNIFKHTSVIGGIFTPYADDDEVYFSYFRHGSMHIYKSSLETLNYERVYQLNDAWNYNITLESKTVSLTNDISMFEPYKFKASTDLFFPAFLFSSPGGLFTFIYWQASDYTGRHTLSIMTNYNSRYHYFNSSLSYLYNRYRTKFFLTALITKYHDEDYFDRYKKEVEISNFGFIYPVDRNTNILAFVINKDDKRKYFSDYYSILNYNDRKRGFGIRYVNNTLNGLYLTAVEGYQIIGEFVTYGSVFGGNQYYNVADIELLKYFPLSRKSALVNRLFQGFSWGRDKPLYSYGGVGGIRGQISTSESRNIAVYNAEIRFPLFYCDYYIPYLFPDFYFKSLYAKFFSDNAYVWNDNFEDGGFKNSFGFGFDIYTFVLQNFRLVLSLDFAFNTREGERIAYFYLGPVF